MLRPSGAAESRRHAAQRGYRSGRVTGRREGASMSALRAGEGEGAIDVRAWRSLECTPADAAAL